MADSQSATTASKARTSSMSQASETSQTAADFIKEQLNLEKEAREALPYVSTFAIPNKFCGCSQEYDPDQEKGTMFQCLGLGSCNDGGCGEDWWHPECLVGFTREEFSKMIEKPKAKESNGATDAMDVDKPATEKTKVEENQEAMAPPGQTSITAAVENGNGVDGNDLAADGVEEEDDDPPLPPGFPAEEDFDHFICYKCVAANPWIKKYAGSTGFLPPIYHSSAWAVAQAAKPITLDPEPTTSDSKKRKATDEDETQQTPSTLAAPAPAKRQRSEDPSGALNNIPESATATPNKPEETPEPPKHTTLPPLPPQAHTTPFSLFLKPSFRNHLCHCNTCYPLLKPHTQLLEEEETYEPPSPLCDDTTTRRRPIVGTGSILDRGEAAFNNMDRVRAIQGAMAYAHLKDKVAAFLKPFAESGTPVGAEDVKAYFEKLRGDEKGIAEAKGGARREGDGGGGGEDGEGGRKEQSGY
ncbi:zinc finger protein Mlo2 [Pyrenophora tritici-repentis Pt-1C-BFP]|uniref:Zinc finger protein Mlo2 n=1 Tax=Pyrenophora tritici-repentis (strain Pt-1C-BFP) TaxID=426418 RepID=B2VT26_PYRTR|nr:zinc finger protein Mlo2 [Pyrenophora tritici-repentis Pt-1C-BFP]EDU41300.1 zinc finger protein Mlo2 [Pyrenophora tritici-repentis Pt-1C-BFP]